MLEPGEDVTLVEEPTNSYDSKAIYAKTWLVTSKLPGAKVGYIHKGKLQDMIHDYTAQGLPIISYIDSVDDDNGIVTLCIAFYRGSIELE